MAQMIEEIDFVDVIPLLEVITNSNILTFKGNNLSPKIDQWPNKYKHRYQKILPCWFIANTISIRGARKGFVLREAFTTRLYIHSFGLKCALKVVYLLKTENESED